MLKDFFEGTCRTQAYHISGLLALKQASDLHKFEPYGLNSRVLEFRAFESEPADGIHERIGQG